MPFPLCDIFFWIRPDFFYPTMQQKENRSQSRVCGLAPWSYLLRASSVPMQLDLLQLCLFLSAAVHEDGNDSLCSSSLASWTCVCVRNSCTTVGLRLQLVTQSHKMPSGAVHCACFSSTTLAMFTPVLVWLAARLLVSCCQRLVSCGQAEVIPSGFVRRICGKFWATLPCLRGASRWTHLVTRWTEVRGTALAKVLPSTREAVCSCFAREATYLHGRKSSVFPTNATDSAAQHVSNVMQRTNLCVRATNPWLGTRDREQLFLCNTCPKATLAAATHWNAALHLATCKKGGTRLHLHSR